MQFLNINWPVVDIILLLALAGFVFYGLWFGLIKAVGSLAGAVAGIWAAGQFYLMVFAWLKPLAFGYDSLGKVIVFILILTLVNRLVCLLFAILDKTFHLIAIIPFLKTINRLGGALLGFIEGGLVLGLILYAAGKYLPESLWLTAGLKKSQLTPHLLNFGNFVVPLLPEVMRKLKSVL